MTDVGKGVREIRISSDRRAYRSMYVIIDGETVYVLHVFEKKTQRTKKRDKNLARKRLKEIRREK